MRHFAHLHDLQALVGQEIGVSEWIGVEQKRIDQFAEATGDHQWIHVDPVRAASGPFGKTIAHGFLTLSLVPEMFATAFDIGDVHMGVNYGLNRVRFTAPVPSGSRVRGHFVLQVLRADRRRRAADGGGHGRAGRLGQAGLRGRDAVAPLHLSHRQAALPSPCGNTKLGGLDEGAAGR